MFETSQRDLTGAWPWGLALCVCVCVCVCVFVCLCVCVFVCLCVGVLLGVVVFVVVLLQFVSMYQLHEVCTNIHSCVCVVFYHTFSAQPFFAQVVLAEELSVALLVF